MTKYLKPIPLVYRCPKMNRLIEEEECRNCEFYFGSEWHRGYWCIICEYGEATYEIRKKSKEH